MREKAITVSFQTTKTRSSRSFDASANWWFCRLERRRLFIRSIDGRTCCCCCNRRASVGGHSNDAHVGAIGAIESARIDDCPEEWENELCEQLRCRDPHVVEAMKAEIERIRKERNSIGSRVDVLVSNLPVGLGEPWFDGLEPALGRAYLSIPAARGVAFGRGFGAVRMTGLEHNNPWGVPKTTHCRKGAT